MPIQNFLESLIKTLQYEYKAYLAILKLAEKKSVFLINSDIDGLTKILEEEKATTENTSQLNIVREQLIAKYSEETGQENKHFTLTEIIEQVDDPFKKQLIDIKSKLSDLIEKLYARNSINEKLIESAVKLIDFNMQLISSPYPEAPTYGKSGTEVSGKPKKSVLDVKY